MDTSSKPRSPGRFDFNIFERLMRSEDQDIHSFAEAIGSSVDMIRQWRRNGITFYAADRISIKMGVHPCYVWGEEYWNPVPRKPFEQERKNKK